MNQRFKLIVKILFYISLEFVDFCISVDKFFGYLLSLKAQKDQQQRIHIEPRLTSKTVAVNEIFSRKNT